MIRLWNSTETVFKGNRWVLNETTKCEVTEVANGEFALDLEHPLKDTKDLSKYLLRGNLITCPVIDNRPEQQFRIRKVDKTSTWVTVYAQAKLIADLGCNYIRPITLTGLTRKQAIQAVLNAALEPHDFVVGNLDTNTNNNVIVSIQEGTVLNALIGKENSILSEYGGEFIISNNEFNIVDSRGANRGFKIAYGKNIASIKETIDDTDLATVLVPKSGDYRLPEYVIESPNVNKYEKRYFQEVDLNLDIWDGTNDKQDGQVTISEAYTLMRTTCNNMFLKDKVDQVAFNYAINLILLRKTTEYKHYNIIEKVYLGDTVTVKHKLLDLDLEGKVNKAVYNVLLDKYSSVEIGFSKQDITDIIKDTVKQIQFTKDQITLEVKNTDRKLSARLDIQEDKIDAVVEEDGTGMGWELSKSAFKVACVGASNAYVEINEKGLEVHDGKFRLYKGSDVVFYVNTSGVCCADGGFIVDSGDITVEMTDEGLLITNADGYEGLLTVDDATRLYIPDDLRVGDLAIDDFCEIGGRLRVDSNISCFGHMSVDSYLDVEDDLWVGGDLDVEGSKPCLQKTESYGKRRITAYETAEYWFGDIGSGIIKDGECIITIEDVFSECVNTNIEYQVFTQSYNGSITSIERFPTYFIVHGEDDTEFGWEIKAKRKNWENIRLEEKEEREGDVIE